VRGVTAAVAGVILLVFCPMLVFG